MAVAVTKLCSNLFYSKIGICQKKACGFSFAFKYKFFKRNTVRFTKHLRYVFFIITKMFCNLMHGDFCMYIMSDIIYYIFVNLLCSFGLSGFDLHTLLHVVRYYA